MIVQQYHAECDNCEFISGDYYRIEVLTHVCETVGWLIDVEGKRIICPHCINRARNPEDRKHVPDENAVK